MNKRAMDEKEYKAGTRKLSEQHKTWSAMLDAQTGQLETMSKYPIPYPSTVALAPNGQQVAG